MAAASFMAIVFGTLSLAAAIACTITAFHEDQSFLDFGCLATLFYIFAIAMIAMGIGPLV